ncbi:MAG TPA: hypothetical protein VGD68_02335 [Streptosporangiaceae bacterium]
MTADTWATVADLGTALGTLILAVATFSAVRSGNRTARAAEQSLLTSLRPLLMPSKLSDDPLKVNFGDDKWLVVPGGSAVAQIGGGNGTQGPADGVIYLSLSLRNVGNGIAVLHGWRLSPSQVLTGADAMPPLSEFQMQTRDMYIPVDDTGFWQGAIRDPADPRQAPARKFIESRDGWVVDLLYGDHDGGQRAISRFRCQHRLAVDGRPSGGDGGQAGGGDAGHQTDGPGVWLATVVRHWTIDRPDPRLADRPPRQ